ncbi:transposase [Lentzea sp. BCCO 10_0061]|uniref:Transposase n=1 Tax=Lentzea sokolovensis TaxID=3095429 RepID=A0ABU4VEW6_9PSEU|nr:transposase [Lentzea sp. BCCO 10_0061]MDX8149897.1 transposase [Lentzea sp. BCCO 10_0061]
MIATTVEQIDYLEQELTERFHEHPDSAIYMSQPGIGVVLGSRVLGEFGDDPDRYAGPKARKNYAGTSPVTITSGSERGCSQGMRAVSMLRLDARTRYADTVV